MPVAEQPFSIGTEIEISGTFVDENGNPANVSEGSLRLYCPDGTTIAKNVLTECTHPSVGKYAFVYEIANGWGIYTIEGDGNPGRLIVDVASFRVKKPPAA